MTLTPRRHTATGFSDSAPLTPQRAMRPSPARKRVYAKSDERGYGWDHQRERRRLEPRVATGRVACVRCGRLIEIGEKWDLDHGDVKVKGQWLGPAHAHCNRSEGGRKLQRLRRSVNWSRSW